jgi:DNA phosphorothioation-dependent restriction protein DptG
MGDACSGQISIFSDLWMINLRFISCYNELMNLSKVLFPTLSQMDLLKKTGKIRQSRKRFRRRGIKTLKDSDFPIKTQELKQKIATWYVSRRVYYRMPFALVREASKRTLGAAAL